MVTWFSNIFYLQIIRLKFGFIEPTLSQQCSCETCAQTNLKDNVVSKLHYLLAALPAVYKILFSGGSSTPYKLAAPIPQEGADMNPNDKCYQTGNYTDDCDCNLCSHQRECSGSDLEDEDEYEE